MEWSQMMKSRKQNRKTRTFPLIALLSTGIILGLAVLLFLLVDSLFRSYEATHLKKNHQPATAETKTARIVANGDILLHNVLYTSARQADGSYDFEPYFSYAKEWIEAADLAIGDYEGTIHPDLPLAGYPLFNAPIEIAQTLKKTGYDVIDLAHNHILDSYLEGAFSTVAAFEDIGLDTVGIYTKDRDSQDFLIKEVNGIKIAILAYSYGYNGLEANLTEKEYKKHLSDLNEEAIKAELEEAEKKADVTIVLPQMGVEYALEPSQEQVELYHKMIEWGADVVFGGHPHVPEPAEIVEKDGERKLIQYSMGNFLSNQTYEMMGDIWPERGLLMDLTFEKNGDKTIIKTAQAHPTIVWAWGKGEYDVAGYEHFDYRILILEDFIEGGKYRDELPDYMKEKVDQAYLETKELVQLNW